MAAARCCNRLQVQLRLLTARPGHNLQLLTARPGHSLHLQAATLTSHNPRRAEKVTHTGQVYDEADYRKVRFVGRQKEVNEKFAINLISEQPITEVADRVVSCDGGGGALGHPKVYINLDKDTKVGTCGYCGLRFKQIHHHH